ncbi:MAG: ABC transporter permease [Gammaproteobacteria bacterium]
MNGFILGQYLRESIQNLWIYKLRSLLTTLGVLVGTASVVALVSSGQAATEEALKQFKNLGTDLLAITIESPSGGQNNAQKDQASVTLEQVEALPRKIPSIVSVAPYTLDFSVISYQGKPLSGNVIGMTLELSQIIKLQLAQGRFVSELDKQQYFCTIGQDLARNLHQSGVFNVLGQQLRLGDRFFTIVGVVQPWPENMFMYANINQAVMIPLQTSLNLSSYNRIQNILFKIQPNTDMSMVQQQIQQALQQQHPDIKLFIRSAEELIQGMQKQKQTFTLLLGAIGGIALLVGGIGVMNIMLVSVIERKREIGIRLAVGARKKDIQWMFLADAVVLTLLGGVSGIVVGELVSWIIAWVSGWGFYFYVTPVLIGFSVSMLTGLFFGYYPAYKAAQLDPIQTLRAE